MKWLRLGFGIISGIAAVSFLIDGQMSLAFFFGIVCAITIWSMSWGVKNGKK